MNTIHLPQLKSIEIKNFNLYPKGLDFKHNFIDGINLIVGGNGMGKTTFVNIIKYGIIGHYKEGFDYTRTYLGKKIEKRISNPWNYFYKRADNNLLLDSTPTVKIAFMIDSTLFEVERCLKEIEILSVSVNNKVLSGDIINQRLYDQKYHDFSKEKDPEKLNTFLETLEKTLPYRFEKEFEKCSNLTFDDLIFFVNKILFFGEDHQTILWDKSDPNVQTELFNKYFNDPDLNKERQEANRQAKYYNTQARHRSEDIRVIRKVLDKVVDDKNKKIAPNLKRQKIEDLKIKKEGLVDIINSIQKLRKELDRELSSANNKMNKLSLEVSQIERNQKKAENEEFRKIWVSLHKNYDNYVKGIKSNEICPLCSQDLDEEFVKRVIDNPNNCILCDQELLNDDKSIPNEPSSDQEVKDIHSSIRGYQKRVQELESKLEKLDIEFNSQSQLLRNLNTELRTLEFDFVKDQHRNSDKPKDNLEAFYNEIADLEIKKNKYQEKSNEHREKYEEISKKIEDEIIKNVSTFSNLFSGYAEKFLGVPCSLTFDDIDDGKRFYPVINKITRESEEELSESQRFFVDHSFRMSILSFFYNNPSFYIIETPDSSLDISYERNAADVFMKFLENPFCLILTTNLNNSEFLSYLAKSSKQISIINLLDIGRKSPIQDRSDILKTIYTKVQSNYQ